METHSSRGESRASALWRRFGGMYGAEHITRKFGENPPREWVAKVGELNDHQLEQGLKRCLNSGRSYMPSLPEFLKFCREAGDEYRNEVEPSNTLPAPILDPIEAEASRHLMAFCMRQVMGRAGKRLAPDVTYQRVEIPGPPKGHRHEAVGGALTRRNTEILLRWKQAWVDDYRASPQWGPAEKRAAWEDCMQRAMAEIEAQVAA